MDSGLVRRATKLTSSICARLAPRNDGRPRVRYNAPPWRRMFMTIIAHAARTLRALLILSAALAMSPGDAGSQTAQKAKVGVLRLSSSAPVFIAQDKGYFKEAGLALELKFFDAAQPLAGAPPPGDS